MWPRPLADEAEAAQAQVEQDEGVDCGANPVLDDAAAAEDADAGGQRPGHQHKVDGDAGAESTSPKSSISREWSDML